jgi:hypothetical protein
MRRSICHLDTGRRKTRSYSYAVSKSYFGRIRYGRVAAGAQEDYGISL